MKIALVTNKELHHKYWVSELYKSNDISLIIHPALSKQTIFGRIKQKNILYFGKLNLALKLMSLIYGKLSLNGLARSLAKAEVKYFSKYQIEYEKIPKDKIVNVETINSSDAIDLIIDHNIDLVCFLGGNIVNAEFISSIKLCLNYHNGISPFYNGNKTNFHAVSDFRPNFTGGTLMVMNERVDGGKILMHYLCPIEDKDKAADLYMKGIMGAVKTYNMFLNQIQMNNGGFVQKRSLKFLRNIDWTIINDIKLNRFYKFNRMAIYEREEKILDYTNREYNSQEFYGIAMKEILG